MAAPDKPAHRSLDQWLTYQEKLHPRAIELGLERVRTVAQGLGLLPAHCPTLTVAGTNGKGSCVALAAEIFRAAGYRIGRYSSPHLLRYNERVVIDGREATDDELCAAFEAVERGRAGVPLTYFEFGTLAALWLFRQARVDVQVLEVGLGGRLDAVNIVDADCALIASIGIDHVDWLGNDRERIGFEKAGVLRAGKPAIYAERDLPRSVLDHAAKIGAPLLWVGRDYRYALHADGSWDWQGPGRAYARLPAPGLSGAVQYQNAAGVLAATQALQPLVPVAESAIRAALPRLKLPGRFQRLGPLRLDVAHNVEAARVLADNLRAETAAGRVWLVLGMYADKPVEEFCATLAPLIAGAYFAGLPPPRGLDAETLARRAAAGGLRGIVAGSVQEALRRARLNAAPEDRILVCGSFLTVAAAAEGLHD